ERYAEPLTALHGEAWPARLLELAWRRVVDDSAHDSICGCSRDEVAAQVLVRFAEAEQIGRGIVERTGRRIAAGVPVGSWAVVNPSPGSRTDLVALDVTVGAETEPAFLSAGQRLPAQEIERTEPFLSRARVAGRNVATFLARRRHGRELLGRQINAVEVEPDADPRTLTLHVGHVAEPPELDVDELVEQALAAVGPAPDAEWELRVAGMGLRRMLVRVPVPPLGWIAVAPTVADGPAAALAVSDRVVVRGRAMSNGLVEVVVDGDGTFRLGGAGRELVGVGRIVDGGDFGDSYDYGPPAEDSIVDEPTSVSVRPGARGPLLGGLFVRRSYGWPVGVEPSGAARTSTTVETEVVTYLELRAGEPFVRVAVEFENRSSDHRVRWHIPLPAPAAVSAAEGQYAVVERGLTMEGGHGEVPLPTFPARGFVQVTGVSVLLDHVVEYELVDDGGELALTVLRSFGLISRNDNPYREDPAGPEVPVPAAQLHGPWRLAFALMPHGGDWSEAGVPAAAERYRHDLLALPGTRRGVDHEAGGTQREGLRIEGAGVVMTALTREGDELELRLVAEHRGSTEARVSGSFTAARRVDLLGRDLGPIATERGDLRLPMGPWEIATLRLS
ncbi:MAG TPA: alpha-mannosidase, partial [Candidatus Dormibacteraeota bacterium]|nr:alpha-mannosidase [Candidatus Dormibacteraeota bacterium]